MRVGISTYAYSWAIGIPTHEPPFPMDIHSFLESSALAGATMVQIADNLPLHKLSDCQLVDLKMQAQELSLGIEVGIRGLLDSLLEKYLDLAQFFNSPILRIVTDLADYRPTPEEVLRVLKKWVPVAIKKGVVLALENHDRFKVGEIRDILAQFDPTEVGVCLDTVNSLGALEGPDVVIQTLAPYTVNVHLKDFRIFRPYHNMGFVVEGTPAGEGMLDLDAIFLHPQLLTRDPSVVLELLTPPESSIEKTIKKEMEWVTLSMQNLNRYFGVHTEQSL